MSADEFIIRVFGLVKKIDAHNKRVQLLAQAAQDRNRLRCKSEAQARLTNATTDALKVGA